MKYTLKNEGKLQIDSFFKSKNIEQVIGLIKTLLAQDKLDEAFSVINYTITSGQTSPQQLNLVSDEVNSILSYAYEHSTPDTANSLMGLCESCNYIDA